MNTPLKGACIVGQSGGPTSVINASLYGALTAALEGIDKANWEVSFLRNPASLDAGSQDPYLPGAERPTLDTGVDFHRYMK